MPSETDLAGDQDWARAGDELDYGTELIVEWGVRFDGPNSTSFSLWGDGDDMEQDVRAFVANYPHEQAPAGSTAKVVARRVLTGPWGERDE